MRCVAALLAGLLCIGSVASSTRIRLANATFSLSRYPYFPGSRIPLHANGLSSPSQVTELGIGTVENDLFDVPLGASPMSTTLIVGASHDALASREVHLASPPDPSVPFIAVASYETGIVLHSASPPFAAIGTLGIGGAPSDVAIGRGGLLAAADTTGTTATTLTLAPWKTAVYQDVPYGDDVAIDDRSNTIYVSDRDFDGAGAVTRIDARETTHIATQETAEGLALDPRRGLLYAANVNSASISVIDTATSRVRATFPCITRDFSLALSADGSRLYVVSNQSLDSPFATAGDVGEYDVSGPKPALLARSEAMTFPLGIAYDAHENRLFVTDEETNEAYVLDATTLRATHAPLSTCRTPWIPHYDERSDHVYVPCAGSDEIDVFDARTLARIAGAPFATGGYPLAVAVWNPQP